MMELNHIFDSHAHYDDERFAEDYAQLLPSLKEKGVEAIVNIGCDLASSHSTVALTEQFDFIWGAVGIHPHSADECTDEAIETIRQLTAQPKVVAIGEIGLDYHYNFSPRETQRAAFERQLQLAMELDFPVVIHSREATQDTLELLKKYHPRGVVHCYSGSKEIALELLKLGLYISYTGVVTFSNARRILEAVAVTPLDRLLLETDCPYMAPVPHRGKRCESWMIERTASAVASIKGIDTQELIDFANQNTRTLFGIE